MLLHKKKKAILFHPIPHLYTSNMIIIAHCPFEFFEENGFILSHLHRMRKTLVHMVYHYPAKIKGNLDFFSSLRL